MRRPTLLDWGVGLVAWAFVSGGFGAFLHMGLTLPEELATVLGFGTFFGGVALARFRFLRRGDPAQPGLTTGEVQLVRIDELEQRVAELESVQGRVAELEERLDFAERLLARQADHQVLGRGDG